MPELGMCEQISFNFGSVFEKSEYVLFDSIKKSGSVQIL